MEDSIKIQTLLKVALKQYCFSGCQFLTGRKSETLEYSLGRTSYWPLSVAVDAETYFDIASLTKVVSTTSILARYVDRKILKLESQIESELPIFLGSKYGKIKIKELLSHSSGLIAWAPYFKEKNSTLLEYFKKNETYFFYETERKVVYSDLNFWLLGLVIEKIEGEIHKAYVNEVKKPLGLKTDYLPYLDKTAVCAATQYCDDRNYLIQGEVADTNTSKMSGVASHAGLFSTVSDLKLFCREWLNALSGKSKWLSLETAKLFTERSHILKGSSWAFGFDTRSEIKSSAGSLFSEKSFGHLGYTGCSLWIDPVQDVFCLFLTNRVHPSILDERIKNIRPLLHDEVVKYWNNKG